MAKGKAKISKERQQELDDVRDLMNTVAGSRFILRLISITGPYRSTFNPDQSTMSFLEGNRNFGCRIVSDLLEACPEQYVRLIAEAKINQQAKENNDAIHISETIID